MTTKAKQSSERGQGMVELALILPILLVLVLGIIDLGMGFRTYIGLTNAAREGARWVAIHPDDVPGALARAEAEAGRVGLLNTGFSSTGIEVSLTPSSPPYVAGQNVTLTIRHDYPLLFGLVTGLPEVPFRARATMVVLYAPE